MHFQRREIRLTSLADQVYEHLRLAIISAELPPAEKLIELDIARQMNTSQGPVREALQRLVREGLIVVLPQRGTLVSEIDVAMQLRLLEVRRELERLIARLAARRANADERKAFAALATEFAQAATTKVARDAKAFMRADRAFNDLCLRASRNEFAAGAMGLMHGLCRRFFYSHSSEPKVLQVSAKAHADLAKAIAAGSETPASDALDPVMD